MYILGISAFHGSSSAALIRDGILVSAAQEERFTRKLNDSSLPIYAIEYCLGEAGISIKEVNLIGISGKPLKRFERMLINHMINYPKSFAVFLKELPVWLKEYIWVPQLIRETFDYNGEILFIDHLLSHAASAFLVSPFHESAILVVDDFGEANTTILGMGKNNEIKFIKGLTYPDSLVLFYQSFVNYLGFESINEKFLELALCGQPKYYDLIMDKLVYVKEDGSFQLNMGFFSFRYSNKMISNHFLRVFRMPNRNPESEITQFHKDVAASVKKVIDLILLKMVLHLKKETGARNLCVTGKVAVDYSITGDIFNKAGFDKVFIHPAADDFGTALGVAFYISNVIQQKQRAYTWINNLLGPGFLNKEIEAVLKKFNMLYHELNDSDLLKYTAKLIANQNIVAWFQGRMEFGNHSLGARSIIADPRNKMNVERINYNIKYQNDYKIQTLTVLREKAEEYFEFDHNCLSISLLGRIKENKSLFVPNIEGSVQINTICRQENPLFYDLIVEFEKLTNCPIILNCSLCVKEEPMACAPIDALRFFFRSDVDYLVIGNYILNKTELIDSEYIFKLNM